jgi:anti-sigma regulatory factor (Ser/Thr protein kinase)
MGQAQRLTVPGRFEHLAQIAEFVTQAAREAGLTDDDVFHVEMAVDEACSNVIEHAYADTAGEIDLTCFIPEYGRLDVVIHDHGEPFDPEAVPEPKVGDGAGLEAMQEGGLGLYFMRKLMDDVRFSFSPGDGNTLYMVKRKQS